MGAGDLEGQFQRAVLEFFVFLARVPAALQKIAFEILKSRFGSAFPALPSSFSVSRCFFFHKKADFAFFRLRRRHQLANSVENDLELGIVFLLQLGQLASQLRIGRQHLPQPNEGTHDFDIDLDGPATFEYGR